MNTTDADMAPVLRAWLEIATRDLGRDARTRVMAEVRAHFEQHIEAALAEGVDSDVAQAAAIAALGPAKSARTRLNKTCLTKGEEEMVKVLNGKTPLIEIPQPCWPLDWGIYVAVAMYTLMGQYFLVVLFAPSSWGRVVRHFMRDRPQSEVWRLIALMAVCFIPLTCVKLAYRTLPPDATVLSTNEIFMFILNMVGVAFFSYFALRIAAKLPRDKGPVQS